MHPVDDVHVDAQALTFEWEGPPADDFVLEVARDPDFSDVVARVPTGNSTSITVYDLFRPDGTRYHWRVASSAFGASISRSFVATPFERLGAVTAASTPSTATALGAVARMPTTRPPHSYVDPSTAADTPALYRAGVTSSRLSGTVVLVMLLSFIVTVGVIFLVSVGI